MSTVSLAKSTDNRVSGISFQAGRSWGSVPGHLTFNNPDDFAEWLSTRDGRHAYGNRSLAAPVTVDELIGAISYEDAIEPAADHFRFRHRAA